MLLRKFFMLPFCIYTINIYIHTESYIHFHNTVSKLKFDIDPDRPCEHGINTQRL